MLQTGKTTSNKPFREFPCTSDGLLCVEANVEEEGGGQLDGQHGDLLLVLGHLPISARRNTHVTYVIGRLCLAGGAKC